MIEGERKRPVKIIIIIKEKEIKISRKKNKIKKGNPRRKKEIKRDATHC